MTETSSGVAIVSGGMAGLCVDMSLFPLDTIKTRLQSAQGFWKAGGFRSIYAGIASAATGSVPTAALFFVTYEGVKKVYESKLPEYNPVYGHMMGASAGEVMACIARVPVEVVKQRAQAASHKSSLVHLGETLKAEGFRGLYRGYFSTVWREVPFSFLQFPLWEYLKKSWSSWQGHPIAPWQASVCGAVAGGAAAGITTPLDVAKTRIMLAPTGTDLAKGNIIFAVKHVYNERGVKGLFAGITPRMLWMSIGGAIFLGVYEKCRRGLIQMQQKQENSIQT